MKMTISILSLLALTLSTAAHAANCDLSEEILKQNKATAIKSIQASDYAALLSYDLHARVTDSAIAGMLKRDAITQFNHDSAMRAQVGVELAELQDNGRNSSNGIEIYTKDALFCTYFTATAKNTTVKLSATEGNSQTWQITITFQNGYHGGSDPVSFIYTVKTTKEKSGINTIVKLAKQPLLVEVK